MRRKHVGWMLCAAVLSSCVQRVPVTTTIEGYASDPQQAATLAMVHTWHALLEFDDLRLYEPLETGDVGRRLVIPPGRHAIKVRSAWSDRALDDEGYPAPAYTYSTLVFTAEARGEYTLHVDRFGSMVDRDPRIIDAFTHEKVSILMLSSNSREGMFELRFGQKPMPQAFELLVPKK